MFKFRVRFYRRFIRMILPILLKKMCFCCCALFTATITDYAGNAGFSYGKASVLGTY